MANSWVVYIKHDGQLCAEIDQHDPVQIHGIEAEGGKVLGFPYCNREVDAVYYIQDLIDMGRIRNVLLER